MVFGDSPQCPFAGKCLESQDPGVLRCDIVRLGERNQAFELG